MRCRKVGWRCDGGLQSGGHIAEREIDSVFQERRTVASGRNRASGESGKAMKP